MRGNVLMHRESCGELCCVNCIFTGLTLFGSFRFVPPSLVGACYLQPPVARAIFLHNNLLCNGACSVNGARIT